MSPKKKYLSMALAGLAVGLLAVGQAQAAVTYVTDASNTVRIPGLTGYTTDGSQMSGMRVTAVFADTTSQALSWATTGAASGGVTGTGWSLAQSGNTYGSWGNYWNFSFTATTHALSLTQLILNGSFGLTVFDRTFGNSWGTPDSAQGWDLQFSNDDISATVTYSDQVAIGAADPVGDLWHTLTIDFGQNGIRQDFAFLQDTDNDSRYGVPEPATLGLLGLALAGLGWSRRNRKIAN